MEIRGRVCIEVRRVAGEPDVYPRWTFTLVERRGSAWARVTRPAGTFATWSSACHFAIDVIDAPPGLLGDLVRTSLGR